MKGHLVQDESMIINKSLKPCSWIDTPIITLVSIKMKGKHIIAIWFELYFRKLKQDINLPLEHPPFHCAVSCEDRKIKLLVLACICCFNCCVLSSSSNRQVVEDKESSGESYEHLLWLWRLSVPDNHSRVSSFFLLKLKHIEKKGERARARDQPTPFVLSFINTCWCLFCFETARAKQTNKQSRGVWTGELEMVSFKEITLKVTGVYMQLSIIVMIIIIQDSKARELRPSDHGLEYQSMPPTAVRFPPDMKQFFGASSAATSTSSSGVALPKAMNSNDTSWWRATGGRGGGGGGGDRVRHVLLVASLVCGVTGLALLVASALIFYFMRHKNQSSPSSTTDNNHRSIVVYSGKN